jgi:glutaredoxin 3
MVKFWLRHREEQDAMQPVDIYTSPLCGFCHAAKRLLSQKGVPFTEIDIARQPAKRAEMMQRASGRHTVPQIFVGTSHVGGCDELFALERSGKLDPLLKG